ncbi:MAG TPA: DUF1343 domain-containing protein [Bacteroidales bacterium]|nr:DUF1343 domain-containing protein [Bacteroidales bacterium]MDD4236145.1 DUF1343 domain-containing protein [Bacteroidales bacterium]HXK82171.1 DUF1343 domain-containing protein [Bacteroidales bacterium]
MLKPIIIVIISSVIWACSNKPRIETNLPEELYQDTINVSIHCGAELIDNYINMVKNKNIAIVANQTSQVNNVHLLDTLLAHNINVIKVFCPEHGFRGDADAGALIDDSKDLKTGIPIVSLYGNNKKPKENQIEGIDIILFDLQDVGVRFYTYISTLHYVMEACAENNIKLIVLDRPNPNGYYVDGPVLDTAYKSFIGMHPVPIVHGMTIGEYATMINGEKWLSDSLECDLYVVKCKGWLHSMPYNLPVKPSPNLPNYRSVQLYPSICLLEGTAISIGRGTDKQFQLIGHPYYKNWAAATYSFTPNSNVGAQNPKLKGKLCYGFDLSDSCYHFKCDTNRLNIDFVMECYKQFPDKNDFFKSSFNLLSGGKTLKMQIIDNMDENKIRETWEPQLSNFKKIRKKYLLYDE